MLPVAPHTVHCISPHSCLTSYWITLQATCHTLYSTLHISSFLSHIILDNSSCYLSHLIQFTDIFSFLSHIILDNSTGYLSHLLQFTAYLLIPVSHHKSHFINPHFTCRTSYSTLHIFLFLSHIINHIS